MVDIQLKLKHLNFGAILIHFNMKFSERYGYVKPSDVIIREKLSREIQNAICTVYDELHNAMSASGGYTNMEEYLWCYWLCSRVYSNN